MVELCLVMCWSVSGVLLDRGGQRRGSSQWSGIRTCIVLRGGLPDWYTYCRTKHGVSSLMWRTVFIITGLAVTCIAATPQHDLRPCTQFQVFYVHDSILVMKRTNFKSHFLDSYAFSLWVSLIMKKLPFAIHSACIHDSHAFIIHSSNPFQSFAKSPEATIFESRDSPAYSPS